MNFQSKGGYFADSEASPSSPSTKRSFLNSTVRPVTVKSLVESQVTPDGRLSLSSGQEASSAIVYGCIRQVKEAANHFDILLEDGTGTTTVRHFFTGDSKASDLEYPRAPSHTLTCRCGKWVEVALTAKTIQNKTVYTATRVDRVSSWNDVLFHFAHCMHVHVAGDQSSAHPPASKLSHVEDATSSAFASMAGSLTAIQATVLKVYAESKAQEGIHIMVVVRRLSEKYNESSVKQTVQWLLDEGYLYVTIDNDHAKSVMEY